MSNGDDIWTKLEKYLKDVTDLTSDAAEKGIGHLGKAWNQAGAPNAGAGGGNSNDESVKLAKEAVGTGVNYMANVWVKTRDLMEDLAK